MDFTVTEGGRQDCNDLWSKFYKQDIEINGHKMDLRKSQAHDQLQQHTSLLTRSTLPILITALTSKDFR